ncbi:hypothetical protein L218DRAFT_1007240 [Marasmius fiardii PR-910]|nr:hypothetical protein L218DRAFT_1007240 [Marasmius fiardii PR-910]
MAQGNPPRLGAGLSLLGLFGLTSIPAQICGVLILTSIIAYGILRYRYPCRSTSSLLKVVDQAKTVFHRCLAVDAFQDGEHDCFRIALQQYRDVDLLSFFIGTTNYSTRIISRASEIASRTNHSNSSSGSNWSLLGDYLDKACILWNTLKDIINCHRQAQVLIYDLEMCLIRASHSHADFQLRTRRASFQALAHSTELAAVP